MIPNVRVKKIIAACHSISHEIGVESGPGVWVTKIEGAKGSGCPGHQKMTSTIIKSVLLPVGYISYILAQRSTKLYAGPIETLPVTNVNETSSESLGVSAQDFKPKPKAN